MVRVCPERDTECPHGMSCPYALSRYQCKPGWDARSKAAAVHAVLASADWPAVHKMGEAE